MMTESRFRAAFREHCRVVAVGPLAAELAWRRWVNTYVEHRWLPVKARQWAPEVGVANARPL